MLSGPMFSKQFWANLNFQIQLWVVQRFQFWSVMKGFEHDLGVNPILADFEARPLEKPLLFAATDDLRN